MTNLRYVLLFLLVLATVFVGWDVHVVALLTLTSSVQEDYQKHLTLLIRNLAFFS